MNVKKTALATAIALTMAGGGSAWAETSTVKGQFVADKLVVGGGETINLSLLGLDKKGEVDRFGESKGSAIMAVVETDKGQILGGSTNPTSDPNPKEGYFTSDVKYIRLNQGVGRVSIFYPEEIVDREETTDTVTVYLQERVPTGEGGVNFVQIGAAVNKEITIKPGVGIIPERIQLGSLKAPDEGEGQSDNDRQDGIAGAMTAGYPGTEITIIDPDFVGNIRKLDRAGSTVRLDLFEQGSDVVFYNDTEKLVRGQAIFILPGFEKAGTYDMVATIEETETDPETGDPTPEERIVKSRGADTLTVLPRREVRGLKLTADKKQIALLNKDNENLRAKCASKVFPYDQLCQGTELHLMVLDEFGNETTKTTSDRLEVVVNDSNGVVKSGAVKFRVDPGMGEGEPVNLNNPQEDVVLGNHPSETLKPGTASLLAKIEGANPNGIANAALEEIKVLEFSLVAKPIEPDMVQTAGTDFDAFFVGLLNKNGSVLMTNGDPISFEQADTPEKRPFTRDPGLVVIQSPTDEENQSFRSPETNIVQANFKKATSMRDYMLHDDAGKYAPVQAMAWSLKAADAVKVVKINGSGDADNPLKPVYVKVNNQFQLTLPESDFRLLDVFGNVLNVYGNAVTPDVGQFTLRGIDGGAVSYPNQATEPFGRPYPAGQGNITVTYGAGAAQTTRHLEARFTKPGLEQKTLLLTVAVPKIPDDNSEPDEPTPDERGPIVTYIETQEIPVNSEVALKVETLDEEGGEIIRGHSVRFQLNGLEEDNIVPSVSELVWSDIKTRFEPLLGTTSQATLTKERCKAEGGQVVGDECEFPLTEIECHNQGYIFTIQGQCREQSENGLAPGERLDLLKSLGQEVLVVNAGSKVGQFSLHFSYTDTKEIDKTLIFKVTREIVIEPSLTEKECLAKGDYWKTDGSTTDCQNMADLTIGGAFMMGADGISVEKTARITGGTSIEGGEIASRAQANLSDKSEIMFVGNIAFAPEHEGEEVDIIAVAYYRLNALITGSGIGAYFSLLEGGMTVLWEVADPAGIEPFYDEKHTIVEGEPKVVEIYTGKFGDPPFEASTIDVWFGYRLDDGTIIFNPESIQLSLLP